MVALIAWGLIHAAVMIRLQEINRDKYRVEAGEMLARLGLFVSVLFWIVVWLGVKASPSSGLVSRASVALALFGVNAMVTATVVGVASVLMVLLGG